MRYIVMISVAVMMMLVGCSQQVAPQLPPIDENATGGNVKDTTQIVNDTVEVNEDKDAGSDETQSTSDDAIAYNSSSDGFKSIYFGFDAYGVDASMQKRIVHDAQRVLTSGAKRIKIEGNCDEFGTDEYNYALGLKRAQAVKSALVANGVPAERLYIVSFGESNPVCSEPTDTCYARNRRVDLRIAR